MIDFWVIQEISFHTVEYDPFTESQVASRNQLYGLMGFKFGHVTADFRGNETPALHRTERPLSGGETLHKRQLRVQGVGFRGVDGS